MFINLDGLYDHCDHYDQFSWTDIIMTIMAKQHQILFFIGNFTRWTTWEVFFNFFDLLNNDKYFGTHIIGNHEHLTDITM